MGAVRRQSSGTRGGHYSLPPRHQWQRGGSGVGAAALLGVVVTITPCFPDSSRSVEATPHLAVFVGVVSGFVFVVVVLVVAARSRYRRQRRRGPPDACPDHHKLPDGGEGGCRGEGRWGTKGGGEGGVVRLSKTT